MNPQIDKQTDRSIKKGVKIHIERGEGMGVVEVGVEGGGGGGWR